MASQVNSTKYLNIWRSYVPILLKTSTYPSETIPLKKIAEETIPNLFYKATNHSDMKIKQRHHKKKKNRENYRPKSLLNMDAKILDKIFANLIHSIVKITYIMIKWDLSQGCKDFSISTNHTM